MKLEPGRCKDWNVGDTIEPLPSDEKYQNCSFRVESNSKKDWDKAVMMGDLHYFLLFKADFSDKNNIKGKLIFKCRYRAIIEVQSDSKERKQLIMQIQNG